MNKFSFALTITLALASLGAVQPAAAMQVVTGSVPSDIATLGLQPVGSLPATQELDLVIGLPVPDRAALDRFVEKVSDPSSPDYRHFLSFDDFVTRFSPSQQDYQALQDFARAQGLTVTATYPSRMIVDVHGSVATIEQAMHVHLQVYQHPHEGRTFYAPDAEPTLDLATRVLEIDGLNDYVLPRALSHITDPGQPPVPQNGSGPGGGYMGYDFRRAYVPGDSLSGAGERVGLFEIAAGFYQSDITYYETLAGLPNITVTPVLIDGYSGAPGSNNGEVSLDIECAMSMAPGLSEIRVYEGTRPNDILTAMAADTSVRELSASWTYGAGALSDQIWQQMASQGQSFFNASGDADAYVGPIPTPSDDPYICIVGGTTLTMTSHGGAYVGETVWNWGGGTGSSGGISTVRTIPAWQQSVSMALNQGSILFRNLPDVGLTADNVYVRYGNGHGSTFGGTSCATPLWAGFTALVNERALMDGLPSVGFINPAVYAIGKGPHATCYYHDTTVGNNEWTGSPTKFVAVTGYDLCTGMGCPTRDLIYGLLGYADPCGPAGWADVAGASPSGPSVAVVLPNPTRGVCSVSYASPVAGPVSVEIIDVSGRVIRHLVEASESAGAHTAAWDGRDANGHGVPAGVYFTRVQTGEGVSTAKLVLAR